MKKIFLISLGIISLLSSIIGGGMFFYQKQKYEQEQLQILIKEEKFKEISEKIHKSVKLENTNIGEYSMDSNIDPYMTMLEYEELADKMFLNSQLLVVLQNTSDKNILGVKGFIQLSDSFGKNYKFGRNGDISEKLNFQIEGNFSQNQKLEKKIYFYLNKIDQDIVYENIKIKDLTITSVVFDDGEILSIE